MDETELAAIDDEQPRTPQISAIRLVLGVLVALTTLTGHLPPRPLVVLAAFVVLGAWFWKAPPYDIGPRVGLANGFVPVTLIRTVTAVREVGGWAAGFGVWGLISGGLVALMRPDEPLGENCTRGTLWGLLGGAVVGALVWAGRQAARDVEIVRAEQQD